MRRSSRPVVGLKTIGVVALSAGLLTAACGSSGKTGGTGSTKANGNSSPASQAEPHQGRHAQAASQGDLTNLDTNQEYEDVGWTVFRAITRQLVSYAGDATGLSGPGDVEPRPTTSPPRTRSARTA